MANLLSSTDIASFRAAMTDAHDSFKQPMTVIKEVKKTVTTPSANYNPLYNQPTTSVTTEEQEFTIYVRTKFLANEGDDEYVTNIQNRFPNAVLRVKIAAADKSTLDGGESLILHGQRYELAGESIPIAPFGYPDHYIYYLKQVK